MASSYKAALKAAKAALDGKNFEAAASEARKVLSGDPNHYHANVFLGLALERSGQDEEAERVYRHALKSKDDDSLAWQGLIGLYEKQASKKIDDYAKATRRLSQILMTADDKIRCQTVVDKFVDFVKQHGTRNQHKEALELIVPNSDLYDYLEGRLPHPAQTYSRIAEIVEAEEKQQINKLIGERRTRLGSKISQVTNDAKREVLTNSPLENIYSQIIEWTNDDDVRRLYEEKLLQRAYDVLSVLPLAAKAAKRQQVQSMATGMVIIKHTFHLAWKIVLEWRDVDNTKDMDASTLMEFMEFFPEDGLTKVLNGWFTSDVCPFPKPQIQPSDGIEEQEHGNKGLQPPGDEDQLIAMTEGLEESSRSILSQRLMADYYLFLEEYASAAETSRKAKELINTEKHATGLELQNSIDAMDIVLATSLVHYQTPRHHGDARQIFEKILQRNSQNTRCLIGLGLIFEEEEEYPAAVDFLTRTLKQAPDLRVQAEAAWCKALAGDNSAGLVELQHCLQELETSQGIDKNFKSQLLYRIGICLWNEDTSKSARKDRKRGYSHFLASLQVNLNYAPAYTILGIYYSDYAKDRKRARKCFQKAFELSASEVTAAERLAGSFADNGEWDLVEVIAQRVIDSGKTRPPPGSKKRGLSWPYAALGVCQINNLDFAKSIVSFQSALRSAPEDLHSWMGLGESYHGSGRYLSATKAFQQVQLIQEKTEVEDKEVGWFSRYMLANVERELGQYDEAIDSFEAVLHMRPGEFGVSVALLQTHVEAAWHNIELGQFGRAAENAQRALNEAATLVTKHSSTFNIWKAIGDASSTFTWIRAWCDDTIPPKLKDILEYRAETECYSYLSELDGLNSGTTSAISGGAEPSQAAMMASILAHKRAIHCCSHDVHAQSVAWYNLGWAEYRAHTFLNSDSERKQRATQFLKASVRCFKRAIELEASNAEFWNSLAIVTTVLNPKVAQHAFIRSLYLNGNSARVWSNLGTFYLLQNDYDLASEALNRGQSTDPDYAYAWLGQGILSLLTGDLREANNLFTHAFEIADSESLAGKRLFAATLFDYLLYVQDASSDLADLLQPLFALLQLKSQAPTDIVYRHISCLLSERVGNHGVASDSLESICADIEAEYEKSEAEKTLVRFAQAKADLARSQLATEEFGTAADNAETALDLSSEAFSGTDPESRSKCRLSAHLTAGLAYFYLDESSKAITMFRTALEESASNPDAVCLLAQVLWAKGGTNERTVAREQLLDCVESHPDHADTIILLAVIAILDEDAETLEAVAIDLHRLRIRTDLSAKMKLLVGQVLATAAQLKPEPPSDGDAPRAEATASTMIAPSQPQGWAQLALLSDGDSFPAQMAQMTAHSAVPPKGSLSAKDMADAYAGTGRAADAQRAVLLAPWVSIGWQGLE